MTGKPRGERHSFHGLVCIEQVVTAIVLRIVRFRAVSWCELSALGRCFVNALHYYMWRRDLSLSRLHIDNPGGHGSEGVAFEYLVAFTDPPAAGSLLKG